jgi:NADH-quinone oxidoreductase subunit N
MDLMFAEFAPALPEIVLALGICLVLLVDLFIPQRWRDVTYLLSLGVLGATALAINGALEPVTRVIFSGSYVGDALAGFLKLFAVVVVATVFLYSRAYLKDRELHKGEYYLLGLFALLGIFVMCSAFSLLTMYLGLEILSLSLYGLVAFDRDAPVPAEAAMKYFVLGAIASGCLLYGISILYGVTGTVRLDELAAAVRGFDTSAVPALLGLAFVLVGIAFKFGAVPFHMWLPDVYEGAPTSVTLFVGTAPKIAAFALVLRVLVDGLGPLAFGWEPMLAVLAVLSLGLGNVVAIAQTNIKRMLGYSTIGHVGFILLGFVAASPEGIEAALFYTVIYVLMAAGAFGVLILMGRRGFESDRLVDFQGLNQRSPWFAGIMLLLMFSMIGVPPLAGFYAKWSVLAALLDAGWLWLAVAGVVFSVIGAFYYLRVIKYMYFDAPADAGPLRAGLDLRLVVSLNGLLVLLLGVLPDPLLALCARVLG